MTIKELKEKMEWYPDDLPIAVERILYDENGYIDEDTSGFARASKIDVDTLNGCEVLKIY